MGTLHPLAKVPVPKVDRQAFFTDYLLLEMNVMTALGVTWRYVRNHPVASIHQNNGRNAPHFWFVLKLIDFTIIIIVLFAPFLYYRKVLLL